MALLRALATRAEQQALSAVVSPATGTNWSYSDLFSKSLELAGGLRSFGFTRGDALISDLPNIPENLLLQTACAQLGVAYCTVKDGLGIERMTEAGLNIRGAVAAQPGFLHESAAHGLALDTVIDVTSDVYSDLKAFAPIEFEPPSDESTPWAYFGSPSAITHGEIHELGLDCEKTLALTQDDRLCVSITLCHSFGIGTAVGGAIVSGASILLPAVGGIRGCGDPKQRASVTLDGMVSENATILFADSHTLVALPDAPTTGLGNLRGGVCKIGSGTDFLRLKEAVIKGESRPLEYAGVQLLGMGKKA